LILNNCSTNLPQKENSSSILPTPIDINSIFNFKNFTTTNYIYLELGETLETTINFSVPPKEKTIRSVLPQFLIEEQKNNYFPEEFTIDDSEVETNVYFNINIRTDSVHYIKNTVTKVNVNILSNNDSFKIPLDSDLFSQTFFIDYTNTPTLDEIRNALVQKKEYDLNQIVLNQTIDKIDDNNFVSSITPVTNSIIYKGYTTIKIKKTQTIDKSITHTDIGFVPLRGGSNNDNPSLVDVQEALAKHNINGCDENLSKHLVFSGSFSTQKTYERKVKVKFDSEMSPYITGEIMINMVCTIQNVIIYKLWTGDMNSASTAPKSQSEIDALD
jgi:hypothetical protein